MTAQLPLLTAIFFATLWCQPAPAQDPVDAALQAANEAMAAADEAERAQASSVSSQVLSQFPQVSDWPNAAVVGSGSWLGNSLVLDMPRRASFQLAAASADFPACGITSAQSGGVAMLRRDASISEYGCWWSFQRESDGSVWVKLEMSSGIEFLLPMRAFDKRPTQL